MIRLSVETDREGLTALWKEAFGDSEDAIGLFLDNRYIPENTVVSEDDGKITSMLFLLDGKLSVKGKLYNSYYLYAAATLKDFRGRGLMAKLLHFSENLAKERNIDFICLKPAEESLYCFYEKYGYRHVFTTKVFTADRNTVSDLSFECNGNSDVFIWDNQALDYAEKQHVFYGGKAIRSREALLLYAESDGMCSVKCNDFTQFNPSDILSATDSEQFEFELPCSVKSESVITEFKKNGMALAASYVSKSIINDIVDAYLYFTLD